MLLHVIKSSSPIDGAGHLDIVHWRVHHVRDPVAFVDHLGNRNAAQHSQVEWLPAGSRVECCAIQIDSLPIGTGFSDCGAKCGHVAVVMVQAVGHAIHAGNAAVGRNRGGRRALVNCSNAKASLISVGSLQAGPKKEIAAGRPCTNPAGTVICGYPATAGSVEQLPVSWSPFTRSVSHARPPVGAMIAS